MLQHSAIIASADDASAHTFQQADCKPVLTADHGAKLWRLQESCGQHVAYEATPLTPTNARAVPATQPKSLGAEPHAHGHSARACLYPPA